MTSTGKLKLLDPWAERYADLLAGLEAHCEGLSAEDLDALESAAITPTQTNCWWAVYGVASLVREVIATERVSRRRREDRQGHKS